MIRETHAAQINEDLSQALREVARRHPQILVWTMNHRVIE